MVFLSSIVCFEWVRIMYHEKPTRLPVCDGDESIAQVRFKKYLVPFYSV